MSFDVVTGGGGFIGSHLVDRLLAEGRKVKVVDNFSVGRPQNLEHHKDNLALAVVAGDVCDEEMIDSVFAGADTIYHLAARADIGRREQKAPCHRSDRGQRVEDGGRYVAIPASATGHGRGAGPHNDHAPPQPAPALEMQIPSGFTESADSFKRVGAFCVPGREVLPRSDGLSSSQRAHDGRHYSAGCVPCSR